MVINEDALAEPYMKKKGKKKRGRPSKSNDEEIPQPSTKKSRNEISEEKTQSTPQIKLDETISAPVSVPYDFSNVPPTEENEILDGPEELVDDGTHGIFGADLVSPPQETEAPNDILDPEVARAELERMESGQFF